MWRLVVNRFQHWRTQRRWQREVRALERAGVPRVPLVGFEESNLRKPGKSLVSLIMWALHDQKSAFVERFVDGITFEAWRAGVKGPTCTWHEVLEHVHANPEHGVGIVSWPTGETLNVAATPDLGGFWVRRVASRPPDNIPAESG